MKRKLQRLWRWLRNDWWCPVSSVHGGWFIENRRTGETQFFTYQLDRKGAVLAASIRNNPLP